MRAPKPSTVIAILLLLCGLGVMLLPTALDAWARLAAQLEVEGYNEVLEAETADYSALWEAAEEYNRLVAEAGGIGGSSTGETVPDATGLLDPLGTGMMGYVDIPKIDVHVPIYQGIDESALQAGAGWWPGSSLPTGGSSTHCVLTAHTGLVRARMFTDLDQLEIGDTFTVTVLDRTLTYEVDQILVTEPSDLSALGVEEGADYVTLYTCTPYGVNTHRLLVRGHRIPTSETVEYEGIDDSGVLLPAAALALALGMAQVVATPIRSRARRPRLARRLPGHMAPTGGVGPPRDGPHERWKARHEARGE